MNKWLIDEWHKFYKLSSVWMAAAAFGLQEAVQYWPQFPDDLKAYFPHFLVKLLAWSSFPAIIIARIVRQKSLEKCHEPADS